MSEAAEIREAVLSLAGAFESLAAKARGDVVTSVVVESVRNYSVLEDGYKFAVFIQSDRCPVTLFFTPAIAVQLVERIKEAQNAASAARMAARDRDNPGWDKPADGKS